MLGKKRESLRLRLFQDLAELLRRVDPHYALEKESSFWMEKGGGVKYYRPASF